MEATNTKEFKDVMETTNKTSVLQEQTNKSLEDKNEATPPEYGSEHKDFELITRQDIESLNKTVHLVDSDEDNGLDLFCYVKCSNTDSDLMKRCRGVVFHGDELVLQAFPYTAEYNHEELPILEEILKDFGKFRFFDSYEGALLRIFNFNGKWFLSTHRKLNAFRSKWASRESFGTLFKKALNAEVESNTALKNSLPEGESVLERFYAMLEPTKQYMFLVLNGEDNRIVCEPPSRPTLFHVGTFINNKLDLDDEFIIPKPQSHHWLNIDEMVNYVSKCDYKHLQGVIAFGPDNTQLKIFHKDYQDLFRVRGNEPSVKFRYLQVRMNTKFTDMLYYLYPGKATLFDDYEDTIFDIARFIHRSYIQRFIKKRYVTVPREEFQVIKECHDWHLSDRLNNRISLQKVIEVLNNQSATSLNHMIRRYKIEQLKHQKEQSETELPRTYKNNQNSPALAPMTGTPINSPLVLGNSTKNLPPPPELNM